MFDELTKQETRVLFLTNNENTAELYAWLKERCRIHVCSERLDIKKIQELRPTLIVSYNYKYIIGEDIIKYMNGRIINLHISYLPWNRGSSPNLWSFIDNTPQGVTIHQINARLDEGMILYQKRCDFDIDKETFVSSYDKLNQMIVELFKEKWEEIESGRYKLYEQTGIGSYHTNKDLEALREKMAFDWNDNVADFLRRYKQSL